MIKTISCSILSLNNREVDFDINTDASETGWGPTNGLNISLVCIE